MSGRHAGRVDDAEGVVWAESIRARALVLADILMERGRIGERSYCECEACLPVRQAALLLREIAGAP